MASLFLLQLTSFKMQKNPDCLFTIFNVTLSDYLSQFLFVLIASSVLYGTKGNCTKKWSPGPKKMNVANTFSEEHANVVFLLLTLIFFSN